jgi:hypothetical protein
MAAPTPTTEPASLIAGDTAKWLKTLSDYLPADGWVLSYTLINAASKITFSASTSGLDYLVNVAAATTEAWTAGSYSWRSQVSKAGEVFTVGSGTIAVQAAFSASTLDNRSFARIALSNIEAYLVNPANLSAAQYKIADRELSRIPIGELLKTRDKLRMEVSQEVAASNLAAGLPDRRRVMVRFGG